jgi:hypothetical protein
MREWAGPSVDWTLNLESAVLVIMLCGIPQTLKYFVVAYANIKLKYCDRPTVLPWQAEPPLLGVLMIIIVL